MDIADDPNLLVAVVGGRVARGLEADYCASSMGEDRAWRGEADAAAGGLGVRLFVTHQPIALSAVLLFVPQPDLRRQIDSKTG